MGTLQNTPVTKQVYPLSAQKLVYRFVYSSVPPQYHRSYTITVSTQNTELIVDSYSEILARHTLPLAEKDFQNFLTKLRQIEIFGIEPGEDAGCAGGVTDRFDIILDDIIINGYVYHCEGRRYGNLGGNTDDAARLFRSLLPHVARKIKV